MEGGDVGENDMKGEENRETGAEGRRMWKGGS